jgi:hypothetical protein
MASSSASIPFDLDREGGTNPISGVDTMGGRPLFALAIVATPIDSSHRNTSVACSMVVNLLLTARWP